MSRHLTRYLIMAITILVADICKELVLHAFHIKKVANHPYKSVLIGMAITVAVFYPAFLLLEKIVEKIAEHFVEATKEQVGNAFIGVIVAFVLALIIIFFVYLNVWFHIGPMSVFKNIF